MIHYMKRAHFTRVFDDIGFKCKIIFHLKISAKAGRGTCRSHPEGGHGLLNQFAS